MNHFAIRRAHERGITLVMALIMLVLLTMLALTSFNLGKSNLAVVGNMQQREESIAAARVVLEEVLSSRNFVATPEAALVGTPCISGNQNSRCVDHNGDGVNDVSVQLETPVCHAARPMPNLTLNLEDPEQLGCLEEGINSACAEMLWEVRATATDLRTNAEVNIVQGVSIRAGTNSMGLNCPAP